MSTRTDLEKRFGQLIVEARRADMTPAERGRIVDVLERETRMILEPIDNGANVWADLGFRRVAR
ncbi:hypothetical protein ACTGJ9_027205 [Bradyrhizobium sp. RDM12]